MRNILSLTIVGLLTSVSYANAAGTDTGPIPAPTLTPVPVYGIRYFCEFEGRGLSEHGHQDRDVRCKVKGVLSGVTASAATASGDVDLNAFASPVIPGGPIEVKCSDGYKLETEYTAIAYQGGTLWINAEKHDKLATLRIKEFLVPGAQTGVQPSVQEDGKRYKADLIAANLAVIHGEGKCKFEYPAPPPVSSFAE